MGSDVGAGAVAGAVRGGMDYFIAGDLRDQRRTLEQQTHVLRSLLTAVEGGVDGIGGRSRGMDVSRGQRPEDFVEAQARATRTPLRLGLVRVASLAYRSMITMTAMASTQTLSQRFRGWTISLTTILQSGGDPGWFALGVSRLTLLPQVQK